MKSIKIVLLFIVLFCSFGLVAQGEKTSKKSDSSANVELNKFIVQNNQLEKQRLEDSISKANLEAEISLLKTTDNLKKETLIIAVIQIAKD